MPNLGLIYNETRYGAGYSVPNFRNVVTSAEGRQRPGAPRWKATFSTEYATPLSGKVDGFVQADVVYRSKVFFNATNDDILSSGSGGIFGGRVGVRTSDQRFGAAVFARNIFDTFRTTFRFPTPIAAQQLDPFSFSQFAGPESNRVIGLSLDARF